MLDNLQIIYNIKTLPDRKIVCPFAIVNASRHVKEDMINTLNKHAEKMGYDNIHFSLYDGPQPIDHNNNVNDIVPFIETISDIDELLPKPPEKNTVMCTFTDIREQTYNVAIHKSNIPLLHMIFTGEPFDETKMRREKMELHPNITDRIKSIIDHSNASGAKAFVKMLEHEYSSSLQKFLLGKADFIRYISKNEPHAITTD